MMIFLYPFVLLLLVFPLVFLVYRYKVKSSHNNKHFSKEMLEKLTFNHSQLTANTKYILLLLILTLFIIALARPVEPTSNLRVPQSKPSVVLAVDFSTSMHSSDVYPSRLALAKQKLKTFVSKAHTLQMGILYYARDAYIFYPLSEDNYALNYMLEHTDNNHTFAPNSNLFSALEGSGLLLKEHHNKHIVLLSDGGEDVSREHELSYIKSKGIVLSALNISPINNASLQKLALNSGGMYQRYTWSDDDINTLIDHIVNLDAKASYKSYDVVQHKEYFLYPLLLALVLLVLMFFPLQKRNAKTFFVLACLLQLTLGTASLNAGVFDFWHLYQAEKYMSQSAYKKAANRYKKCVSTPEGYYNLATALYMSGSYAEATRYYKKALSSNTLLNAKIYHNIANAQVHRHKLTHAKMYYLKSLKYHTFNVTLDNLREVQKRIKIQKKNLHKKYEKLYFKPIGKSEFANTAVFSNYAVKLNDFMPDEEARWFDKISKQKSPLFLQKVHTTRRSSDANRTW